MSILKKIVSALAAVAVVSTSLVATTIFAAEAPTLTAEVITGDALIAEDDGAEAYDIGLKVSFTGFEKAIKGFAFDLKLPADIQAQNKKGLAADMTAANLKNYSLYYNNSAFDDGWGNTTLASDIGAGWTRGYISWINWADGGAMVNFDPSEDNYFVISLRAPSEDYVLPEGSFAITNVEIGYEGESTPIADVVVVDPTTAGGDDPAPVDPEVTPDEGTIEAGETADAKTWAVAVDGGLVAAGDKLIATLTNSNFTGEDATQVVELTVDGVDGGADWAFNLKVRFKDVAQRAATTLAIAKAN